MTYNKTEKSFSSTLFTPHIATTIECTQTTHNEGDWLLGANLLVAALFCGKRTKIENLNLRSQQLEKSIIQVLDFAGVTMSIDFEGVEISPSVVQPFDFDSSQTPKLIYILVALALESQQQCRVAGSHWLNKIEPEATQHIKEEFEKFGATIDISHPNLITIESWSNSTKQNIELSSHNNPYLAIALSIAANKWGSEPKLDNQSINPELILELINR